LALAFVMAGSHDDQPQRIDGSKNGSLYRLHRVEMVMYGRSWASHTVGLVDLDLERQSKVAESILVRPVDEVYCAASAAD
jgi:hypothetical protein